MPTGLRQRVVARKVRLFLIRHAESVANTVKGVVNGRANHTALSANGERQARALGRRLETREQLFDRVDAIHVSPAIRAQRTFEIALEQAQRRLHRCEGGVHYIESPRHRHRACVPVIENEQLFEMSQGQYTGRFREEVYTDEVVKRLKRDQWNFKFPGGESQRDVENRIVKYLYANVLTPFDPLTLSSLDEGDVTYTDEAVVAVFGHAIAFKCFLRFVLNSNPYMSRFLHIDNTGITELSFKFHEKQWTLWRLNDGAHLSDPDLQG